MGSFRYGSVCSGIEGATVAWELLDWRPAWFAETEKFPSAVWRSAIRTCTTGAASGG